MPTLYASFVSSEFAEKAAAALLDHGAVAADVSILHNEAMQEPMTHDAESAVAESGAKSGLTTTTAADAAYGAVKGSVVGLGFGTLAAIAALAIPGIGIVVGGGALMAAAAAAVGSAAAGAAAGGVYGYLKDQGIGENVITDYRNAVNSGGCLLAVDLPTGEMGPVEVEQVIAKYGASNISTAGGESPVMERAQLADPAEVQGGLVHVVETPRPLTTLDSVSDSRSAGSLEIEPTTIDPISGAMQEGVAVDPKTGLEIPVTTVNGTIVTDTGFSLADVVATSVDPITGAPLSGTVIDPVTGQPRTVRVVNGSVIYADTPHQPGA